MFGLQCRLRVDPGRLLHDDRCGAQPFFDVLCHFFFKDTATTEIYTLSLHDALPIPARQAIVEIETQAGERLRHHAKAVRGDRKSTRLNSSHANISYAVFCLQKKMLGVDPAADDNETFTITPSAGAPITVDADGGTDTLNFIADGFFFKLHGNQRNLHSFPTRRSTD